MSTTTDVSYFDERVYTELAASAKKYYTEEAFSASVPTKTTAKLDAKKYKKPIFDFTKGIKGFDSYTVAPDKAETPKDQREYDLGSLQFAVYYGPDELMLEGDYIVDSKQAKMREFARQIDLSVWKGVYSDGFNESGVGGGSQIVDGILDQSSTVADLNGTDSQLDAQGDVYKALVKMVDSIPFRYRAGLEITLGMTSHFYGQANSDTFTFDDGRTEWDTFYEKYITRGVKGFKINPNILISDDAFLDSTDTLNTNDRLFVGIMIPDLIEKVFSRGISMMGEVPTLIGGINQGWGCRLRGCLHDSNAGQYSEQITWA